MTLERAVPWIALSLVSVALVGSAALLAGPARGAREDVAAQRSLIARQLEVVESQLATQREQILTEVREINRKTPRTPAPVGGTR